MSPQDFRRAIDFIADKVFARMGVGSNHFLTIEYLGGEVLVVPEKELQENVNYARERLGNCVRRLRDGVQSNLIGSPRRIVSLHDLFEGNLGTSWDGDTGQRRIKTSPDLYKALFQASLDTLETQRAMKPGRVLVLDRASAPVLLEEVSAACKEGRDLVIRPVFQGGSPDIDALDVDTLTDLMRRAYDIWKETPTRRIEPFTSLFARRLSREMPQAPGQLRNHVGCPFQSDCAFHSLSLDPDGTLHICQEMADSGHYPLGNALEAQFNETTWKMLARRRVHLSRDCQTCEWRQECAGGCMNEAISQFGDPFAKTHLCPVWKALFAEIENDLHGPIGQALSQEMTLEA